jgi:hypothetical protein
MQMMGLVFVVPPTIVCLIVRETEPRRVATGSFRLVEQGFGRGLRRQEGSAV